MDTGGHAVLAGRVSGLLDVSSVSLIRTLSKARNIAFKSSVSKPDTIRRLSLSFSTSICSWSTCSSNVMSFDWPIEDKIAGSEATGGGSVLRGGGKTGSVLPVSSMTG